MKTLDGFNKETNAIPRRYLWQKSAEYRRAKKFLEDKKSLYGKLFPEDKKYASATFDELQKMIKIAPNNMKLSLSKLIADYAEIGDLLK